MGNIKSTLGFLPWHIRLTEILWVNCIISVNRSSWVPTD
jgi:hypothetical protein